MEGSRLPGGSGAGVEAQREFLAKFKPLNLLIEDLFGPSGISPFGSLDVWVRRTFFVQ